MRRRTTVTSRSSAGAIAFALTVVGAPGAARGEASDEPVNSPTPSFSADDTRFTLAHSTRTSARAAVTSHEDVMHLLAMTPYFWNISLDTKARVEACARLEFTVDVSVNVFRLR